MRKHGYAIIDALVPVAVMAKMLADVQPLNQKATFSENEGIGNGTPHVGNLIARSPVDRYSVGLMGGWPNIKCSPRTPMGLFGRTNEIVRLVTFRASDLAGQAI